MFCSCSKDEKRKRCGKRGRPGSTMYHVNDYDVGLT